MTSGSQTIQAAEKLKEISEKLSNVETKHRTLQAELTAALQIAQSGLFPGDENQAPSYKQLPAVNLAKHNYSLLLKDYKKCGLEWLNLLEQQQIAVHQVRLAAKKEILELSSKPDKLKETVSQTTKLLNTFSLSMISQSDVRVLETLLLNAEIKIKPTPVKSTSTSPHAKLSLGTVGTNESALVLVKELTSPTEEDLAFFNNFDNLRKISNPTIIQYFSVDPKQHKIVTEYARHFSLADYETKHMAFEVKLKIARNVFIGLYNLHYMKDTKETKESKPIMHCRLKPSNILLTLDYKAKLGDFGRLLPLKNKEYLLEGGYLPFLAPELFENSPKHSQDTDVYAFGMVLYYLFFDTIPFANQAKTYEDYQKLHKNNSLLKEVQSSNIPPSLKAVICLCLNKGQRPTFSSLLKAGKWYDTVLAEYMNTITGEASNIWLDGKTKMPWNEFVQRWKDEFGTSSLNEQREEIMRILLNIPLALNPDNTFPDITKEDFYLFLKWFGPVSKNQSDYNSMWSMIGTLMQHSAFCGKLGKDAVQKILTPNKYLIRLNTFSRDEKVLESSFLITGISKEGKYQTVPIFLKGLNVPLDTIITETAKTIGEDMQPVTGKPEILNRPFNSNQAKHGGYNTSEEFTKLDL